MSSLTATGYPVRGAAYVTVDWTGSPAVSGVSIVRVTPDGVQTAVRNTPFVLTAGRGVAWDTELPLNTVVFYIASSPQATGILTSNSITVTGYGWLGDPLQPSLDAPLSASMKTVSAPPTAAAACDTGTGIALEAFGDRKYPSITGVFGIIGASRPRLITKQTSDDELVRGLILSGDILCFRLDPTLLYGWATSTYGVGYISRDDIGNLRPSLDQMNWPNREWVLPFFISDTSADTGDGGFGGNNVGVTGATYADLAAGGRTYQNVITDAVTYQQVAQGTF
jgi:hypothetical protein